MARPMTGKGYVGKRGPSWFGYYRVWAGVGQRKKRCVRLGAIGEMTKTQARAMLDQIRKADLHATKGACFVGPASILKIGTIGEERRAMSSHGIGAVAELCVAIDLLRKGLHVFRALSPGAICDLIAVREDGECFRVEVKTACIVHGGRIFCDLKDQIGKFDLLAMLFPDGTIRYKAQSEIRNDRYPFLGEELATGAEKSDFFGINVAVDAEAL